MGRFPQLAFLVAVVVLIFAAASPVVRDLLFILAVVIMGMVVWMIVYIIFAKSVRPSFRSMVRDGLADLSRPRNEDMVILVEDDDGEKRSQSPSRSRGKGEGRTP